MTVSERSRETSQPATQQEKEKLLGALPIGNSLAKKLAGVATEVHVGQGFGIRQALDQIDTCYIVRNGQVKMRDERGETMYDPGSYFGLEALSGNVNHRYNSLTVVVSPDGADLLTIHAADAARALNPK